MKNIDIDMVIFENIDKDKAILENIDIDKAILKNIDIDININRKSYRYDNGAKWVQNLIIFACFGVFPLICGWNIEYLYR